MVSICTNNVYGINESYCTMSLLCDLAVGFRREETFIPDDIRRKVNFVVAWTSSRWPSLEEVSQC